MAALAANHFLSFVGDSDEEELSTCRRSDSVPSLEHPQVFRTFIDGKTSNQQLPRASDTGENANDKLLSDQHFGHISDNISGHVSGHDQATRRISHEHLNEFVLGNFDSNCAASQSLSDPVKFRPTDSDSGELSSKSNVSLGGVRDLASGGEEYDMGELFRDEMARLAEKQRASSGCVQTNFLLATLQTTDKSPEGLATSAASPSLDPSPMPRHAPSPHNPSPLASFTDWSLTAYLCAVQSLAERLGRAPSTSNQALEARAAALRKSRKQCEALAKVAAAMAVHLEGVASVQRNLARTLVSMAVCCEAELEEGFRRSAETQDTVQRSSAALIGALKSFVAAIETLCSATIDDTLSTVRQCDSARLEYDAYLSSLGSNPRTSVGQQQLDGKRAALDRLQCDTAVKLNLAEINRVGVIHRQLAVLRDAFNSYFSNNRTSFDLARRNPPTLTDLASLSSMTRSA